MQRTFQTSIQFLSALFILHFTTPAAVVSTDPLSAHFAQVYSTFAKLASPPFSALGLDSAATILKNLQQKITGTNVILRINSLGIVITECSSKGTLVSMRSVAAQRWFQTIQKQRSVYIATTKDSRGKVLLFWAWPVTTKSGAFGGVIAVKVDPAIVFTTYSGSDTLVVRGYFNKQLLFENGSPSGNFTRNAIWQFPDSSILAINYFDRGSVPNDNQVNSDVHEQNNFEPNIPESNFDTISGLPNPPYAKTEVSKKGSRFLVYLILFLVLAGAWILARLIKKGKVPYYNTERSLTPETHQSAPASVEREFDETVSINIADDSIDEESMKQADTPIYMQTDRSEGADNAKALTAEEACKEIKALLSSENTSEFRKAISSSDEHSVSDEVRKEIYRKIHGQVTHWVVYESTRLSQCVEELSERIGKLEKKDDPESRKIRIDSQRISKEIEAFRNNLSDSEY